MANLNRSYTYDLYEFFVYMHPDGRCKWGWSVYRVNSIKGDVFRCVITAGVRANACYTVEAQ